MKQSGLKKSAIFSHKTLLSLIAGAALSANAMAADYKIDTEGAHASINFKIPHLGYSWLLGGFNKFEGNFSYDPDNLSAAKVEVVIDTTSIDSNHAERDKHLRSKDFLDTDKFGQAKFVSTKVTDQGDGSFLIDGDLTLHGVTKAITIDASKVGEGTDPWGGYRAGFAGTAELRLKDFGIPEKLGPASTVVTLDLHVEGVRQ